MIRLAAFFLAVLLPHLVLAQAPQESEQEQPRLEQKQPQGLQLPRAQAVRPGHRQLSDLNRRVLELDRLLSLKSVGRAESLLANLEQHSVLDRQLMSRRIRLAQLKGEHRKAVDLCRQGVIELPLNSALWRSLASSLLAVDQPDSARLAVDMYLATSPSLRSSGMVAVELFQQAGRPRASLALIDSLRVQLPEPRYMSRQRAICFLQIDRSREAADEVVEDLRFNPFNLSLLRNELLEWDSRVAEHPGFMARLLERRQEAESVGAESLLLAGLYLTLGDAQAALQEVRPRLGDARTRLGVLQNAVSLSQELDLLDDRPQLEATVVYLLDLLERMLGPENPDPNLRRRAADHLAQVCQYALEYQVWGDDDRAAVNRFTDLLALVRQHNPTSEYLYSSQIQLARYTRDVLGAPEKAARSLERMLLNLDLPTQGVALARLTLGECYLAAGDTNRGRVVLTQLGRDPDFREAGGHAHYHLARLDLAQGHFATARDRFAVVAMDNPAAPYANDSLDLGLAIAEEMDNPSGGPFILNLYALSVYHDLVDQPEQKLAALENFVYEAGRRLDPEDKQHLLERGLMELAEEYAQAGDNESALERLTQIINNHPDGRYPGAALVLRAGLLEEMGREQDARNDLERLLAQYPDYLFIDDIRDRLRNLP
jgi:tetratricopeptide (TPR) repeat protein